jgi:type III pantothenate kinase
MNDHPFLLIDAGNTNTDFALATRQQVLKVVSVPTTELKRLPSWAGRVTGAVIASVVPAATKKLLRMLPVRPVIVSAFVDLGIGVRYPNKKQIGADRLANAAAAVRLYGAPSVVVDFGTAVTFDVINPRGEYVGGVIAPGIAAMTDYLHEHTALLPRITPREPRSAIGKSTVTAMQVGAVIGYRGLVKEIIHQLRREPGMRRAKIVATGGYGDLIARKVIEIDEVNPLLTLEGLRLIYGRNSHEPN